jgi:hypothetical protein
MGKQLCKHKDREITWMENTPEYIEKPIDLPQVTGKLCKCKSNTIRQAAITFRSLNISYCYFMIQSYRNK